MAIYALPPLLPDALYHGLPLSLSAYDAHMAQLYTVAQGGWVCTDRMTDAEHQGWMACWGAGLVYQLTDHSPIRLTARGERYLSQRMCPDLPPGASWLGLT